MNVVELVNVSKKFSFLQRVSYKELIGALFNPNKIKELKQEFLALENISFEVNKGECLGIIGRNGAGKSTLLSIIAGIIKPTKGKIITRGKIFPLLELGSGFHPDLNAYENALLNGVLLGIPLKTVKNKLKDIIDFAELGEFATKPVRTYSNGMLLRLGFSIITQLDPEILLIDEVIAVGDEKFRKKCLDFMFSLRRKGVTIILVSHNLEEVKTLCDRVVWLENRKVKAIGKPTEVINQYLAEVTNVH